MVENPVHFVRTRQQRQSAQFDWTVTDRCPAGIGLKISLEVDKILVYRRGVFRILREP